MINSDFCLVFSLSPGIGPKRFQKLLKIFGSEEAALKGGVLEFKKAGIGKVNYATFDAFRKTFDIAEYLERLRKAKVEFIPFNSVEYPIQLKKIDSPPIGLFVKGNKKLLLEKSIVAVVGARKITSYGLQVTQDLVSELCSQGFTIVSGMALGVDGIAHGATITSSGSTIAVLGCGVDCPYPRENEKLYEKILDSNGLIISEYPLGMSASKGTFPARNRIIAGVSSAVLITEAAEDSGSLITATCAIEQDKPVFAVPGPITSKMSKGALKLLKQGAVLVSSVNDILETMKVKIPFDFAQGEQKSELKSSIQNLKLTKKEKKIVDCLKNEERTIDEIVRLTKVPTSNVSIILSEMELRGLVRNVGGEFSLY